MSAEAPISSVDLGTPTEPTPPKEKFRLTVPYIGIAGFTASGKSTLARGIAAKLGIEHIDIGLRFRERRNAGLIKRDDEFDRIVDAEQSALIANSTPENPIIIDSRLNAFLADRVKRHKPGFSGVTILVDCSMDERANRAKGDRMSKTEAETSIRDTDKKDIKRFRRVHKGLIRGKPFDKNSRNRLGQRIYDKYICTTERTKEETLEAVFESLLQDGFVVKV